MPQAYNMPMKALALIAHRNQEVSIPVASNANAYLATGSVGVAVFG